MVVVTRKSSVKLQSKTSVENKKDDAHIQTYESRKFICVNCMSDASSLYTTYSKEVVRITECKCCGEAVDKYVEYDIVLVFIDLILQYSTAYRHLLLNTNFKSYYRLASIFLLCDAYEKWIERRAVELTDNDRIYDLEWHFYGSLLQSLAEINEKRMKLTKFLEVTFMGFYGNIFVVFSIVWKLHQHCSKHDVCQFSLGSEYCHGDVWVLIQKVTGKMVKSMLDTITSFI
uniref:Protein ARV n=1 Tax=Ditylenchus dipsaci TaxID=166011 RepID=A0A915DM46_9BILA